MTATIGQASAYWSAFFVLKQTFVGTALNDGLYLFDSQSNRLVFAAQGYTFPQTAFNSAATWRYCGDTPSTDPKILEFVLGADAFVYVNGAQIYTNTASAVTLVSGTKYLGCAYDLNTKYKGLLGEVVMIPQTVSSDTRLKIEGYLAHKWGLSASLSSDHTYRYSPPTV